MKREELKKRDDRTILLRYTQVKIIIRFNKYMQSVFQYIHDRNNSSQFGNSRA